MVERTLFVREVHAAGYRSLKRLWFPVGMLSVFVGFNGAGKTNLYRALQLLQAAANGTFAEMLAREGGMESALWAGLRRDDQRAQIKLSVCFALSDDPDTILYSYEVVAGLTSPCVPTAFPLEPQIKQETLTFHHRGRRTKLLERRGPALFACNDDGKRVEIRHDLMASETALGTFDEPQTFPDIHGIRQTMLDWRFYHDLRTDADAPLRKPCLAVTSRTLAADGSNLAAVMATLRHLRGETIDLAAAVNDAFPGALLDVPLPMREASFGVVFREHPQRVFQANELSDGTLRYIALIGALLSLDLPAFIALNEPESSLHPDLLEPLARLVVAASKRTQIWLVTHSERFAEALQRYGGVTPLVVIKREGETWIEGLKITGSFVGEDE